MANYNVRWFLKWLCSVSLCSMDKQLLVTQPRGVLGVMASVTLIPRVWSLRAGWGGVNNRMALQGFLGRIKWGHNSESPQHGAWHTCWIWALYCALKQRFPSGCVVPFWPCHSPAPLSHSLTCVYLIYSEYLSPPCFCPSSFPHKSCLTNSGQGQLSSTERWLPLLELHISEPLAGPGGPSQADKQPWCTAHACWILKQWWKNTETVEITKEVQSGKHFRIGHVTGGQRKVGTERGWPWGERRGENRHN